MRKGQRLRPPLFELGLKAYAWGARAADLARAMEALGRRYGVTTLLTPQYVDIPRAAEAAPGLLVLSPHLDPVAPGRGSGSVLAEAVREAGAAGALLNHAEKPVSLGHLARAIRRADEAGLLTVVCADSAEEAAAAAHLGPDVILAEPSDLIGGTASVAEVQREFIPRSVSAVRAVDPAILVVNSAGIRSGADAGAVIRFGADGTGSTSGVLTAADPFVKLEEMIAAVAAAWAARSAGKEP